MKLQQQVTSLELSKRLKELGVKQESIFDWCEMDDNEYMLLGRKQKEFKEIEDKYGDMEGCISAFTVAELGEMLPAGYFDSSKILYPSEGNRSSWRATYYEEKVESYSREAKIEADARAKMAIYLLENKLITL